MEFSLASLLQFDDGLFGVDRILQEQGDNKYWTMDRSILQGRFHLDTKDRACTLNFRPPDVRESNVRHAARVLQNETAPVRYARDWTADAGTEIKMMKLLERAVKCYACGRRCYDDYGQKIAVSAADEIIGMKYVNESVCVCENKGTADYQIVCKPGVAGETPLHNVLLLRQWELASRIMDKCARLWRL